MKAFPLAAIFLMLFVGCASHGTWSKSDRGAWASLGELIGSHEKSFYVKQWGEPVSQHETHAMDESRNKISDGVEMLWLWRPDGTGISAQPGQGWEVWLSFSQGGSFRGWRIEGYQSTLTIPDVIAATRKFEYRVEQELLGELGLLETQHGIDRSRSTDPLTMGMDLVRDQYGMGPDQDWRGWAIIRLQKTVRVIAEATYRSDNVARNLHGRLATDVEVLGWLDEQAKATDGFRPYQRQRRFQGTANSGTIEPGYGDLLGAGFLGPYTPNAYGAGMNADAAGRPFIWQPDPGFGPADPFSRVKPNVYGPGIGMDQYGRPVRPTCPPGWTGPC